MQSYNDEFTTADHEKLIALVNDCIGSVILCTFDNDLYDTGLKGFEKVVIERTLNIDRWSSKKSCKINEVIFVKRNQGSLPIQAKNFLDPK